VRDEELERLASFEEWYWWHRARRSVVCRVLQRYVPPRARVLDVGCGTGATTVALRRFGSVSGLDMGLAALRHARARGLPVACGSAERLPLDDGRLDVIVALDVLEHLEDDRRALREILRALRPGGVLLVTVPAYPFLWSSHDEALGHRRRYRLAELRNRISAAGFQIELCSYVMALALPVAAAVRLAERLRPPGHRPSESGYVRLPRLLNDALAQLTSLSGWLLGFMALPFGLSVLAVGRRPAGSGGGSGADPVRSVGTLPHAASSH
jgi:SAM-dependent methyltransferase